MNDYGITENSRKSKMLQYKKHLRLNTTSFIATLLFPFIVVMLFSFGVIKGKKNISVEYAVALIDLGGSHGSGFRISETKMLTAKHVVEDLEIGDEVSLVFKKFETPIEVSAKILFMPSEDLDINDTKTFINDFAILEIVDNKNLNEVPILNLGSSADVETKEVVYAIGYPSNNTENKITEGIISAAIFNSYNFLFDMTAEIDSGNSGGPLILKSTDDVIGIIILLNEGDHSNAKLTLKIDDIISKLEKSKPDINLEE